MTSSAKSEVLRRHRMHVQFTSCVPGQNIFLKNRVSSVMCCKNLDVQQNVCKTNWRLLYQNVKNRVGCFMESSFD